MSQIFDDKGRVMPVTVVHAEPNIVVQVKTKEKDGYSAVQVGFGKKRRFSKALKGHMKDLGNFRFLREFPLKDTGDAIKAGDAIKVDAFILGDKVKVSGISKGKGFQGAVKRHGFHGMPSSHGHSAVTRHIGSIGQRFPQHTLKGKRMAGHMGHNRVTVRGLHVAVIDVEHNVLAVSGAVPGQRGSLLFINTQSR